MSPRDELIRTLARFAARRRYPRSTPPHEVVLAYFDDEFLREVAARQRVPLTRPQLATAAAQAWIHARQN